MNIFLGFWNEFKVKKYNINILSIYFFKSIWFELNLCLSPSPRTGAFYISNGQCGHWVTVFMQDATPIVAEQTASPGNDNGPKDASR